jgi:putative DNA primase/helicase
VTDNYDPEREAKAKAQEFFAPFMRDVKKTGRKARKTDACVPSDATLADGFADHYSSRLRYVAAWSKWFHYDRKVWREERTNLVRDLTKAYCQNASRGIDSKEARGVASSKTIAGVQTLAAANRKIAATVERWDADPWLLNTPGGVVDLKTAEIVGHDPDDHMTKITAVEPGGECPRWLAFLDKVFAGDQGLISYMQRALGYSLTGSTQEHAMFFNYGAGGNGKSVLFDTIAGILGDYHTTAPIETFTLSAGDRHPTELARLVGARLVTALETEQGRHWAESRIKSLTGGDRVAARFMRQDFFEFKPQFKLFIAGNHQPLLRTVDEAIKRRFNMVPFSVTIPPEERDPELAEKLKAEWPGILQWLIDGCIAWQEQGRLAPPDAVTTATNSYMETQDAMAAWLEECCDVRGSYSDTASKLYASWKAYAAAMGEEPGSSKSFGSSLETKGFRRKHTKNGNVYQGVKVKPAEPAPHWTDDR